MFERFRRKTETVWGIETGEQMLFRGVACKGHLFLSAQIRETCGLQKHEQ